MENENIKYQSDYTDTNNIGSIHWFRTIISNAKHRAEYLKEHQLKAINIKDLEGENFKVPVIPKPIENFTEYCDSIIACLSDLLTAQVNGFITSSKTLSLERRLLLEYSLDLGVNNGIVIPNYQRLVNKFLLERKLTRDEHFYLEIIDSNAFISKKEALEFAKSISEEYSIIREKGFHGGVFDAKITQDLNLVLNQSDPERRFTTRKDCIRPDVIDLIKDNIISMYLSGPTYHEYQLSIYTRIFQDKDKFIKMLKICNQAIYVYGSQID